MAAAPFESFLLERFSRGEAMLLKYLFDTHVTDTSFCLGDITLEKTDIEELILLGYEERILLPSQKRAGSAWEDLMIDFAPDSTFAITPVASKIPAVVNRKGFFCLESVLQAVFSGLSLSEPEIHSLYRLLSVTMANSTNFRFEAGLMKLYYDRLDTGYDLHDILDLFVLKGIMSPCPGKSFATRLSWYEISPALFWGA